MLRVVSQWNIQEASLPVASTNMAIGYDESEGSRIYILYALFSVIVLTLYFTGCFLKYIQYSGGYPEGNQMVTCNADYKSFRDYGEDFLSFLGNEQGERGQGSVFYTQLSTTLFTIPQNDNYIHVYDLNPATLSFRTLEQSLPITVGDAACLASSNTPSPRLYLTGGYTNYSGYYEIYPFFWIFDLENYAWTRGNDMNYARYSHGCVVVDDTLWTMGTVSEIETINVTDIYNAEWSVHNNLSIAANLSAFGVVSTNDISLLRCGWYGINNCNNHSIFIIGGWIGDRHSGQNSDVVYIIDTEWGNMTYDTLPFGVSAISTILFDGSIYVFGGWNATDNWWDGQPLDHLITYELLS